MQVQEAFAYGISAELTRLRTAEKACQGYATHTVQLHGDCELRRLRLQVSANTRATVAAAQERTKSAAAVASQQVCFLLNSAEGPISRN